jgi:hypothetical protein
LEPRPLPRGSLSPLGACSIHLRVDAGLVSIARAIRLLHRNAVDGAEVAIERYAGQEVARVSGTLAVGASARRLAKALARARNVLHAVILSDSQVVAEFWRSEPAPGARWK